MKAAAFDYRRAETLADALAVAEGDARWLAGGQSLGPALNLRLATPQRLVDIRRLAPLRAHAVRDGRLTIGAAITHAEIEDGLLADTTQGMLPAVARNIAYRAIRNRGTIGGSLAHADPAADWVNCLIALGADCRIAGARGERQVPAEQFIRGAYQTALTAGELLTSIELPRFGPRMRWGYYKICSKVGEFASAIGAVVHDPDAGVLRLLAGAIEARPLLLPELAPVLDMHVERAREVIAAELATRLPKAGEVFVHQHAVALARAIEQMRARDRVDARP